MSNDIQPYSWDSSKDESVQGTGEDCQFDNIYSQFKDEGNSSGENSITSSDKENEESSVDKDLVTYQRLVREQGNINKKKNFKPKNYGKKCYVFKETHPQET